MRSDWPTAKLGQVLRYRKEFICIDDQTTYRRPRVQLHSQGIVLRDQVLGALIKTKRQQICRARQFLVAEIDAKVGGFGIVPDDLDGVIVSSHYFLFEIDNAHLEERFLDYFIRTATFRNQVEAQGSTNYAAIRPADVLAYEMPLPPLSEQRRVVQDLDRMSAGVSTARTLRTRSIDESASLVISNHCDLSQGRVRALGEILDLHEERVGVHPTGSYPQVGVRSFGGGLFPKGATAGFETTYRTFNRLFPGAIVLSQVKGWEGAVAACPDTLVGWFVSPEYRTFRCIPGEARFGYLAALVRTPWFWRRLEIATRGVGARRERTRPEQFLEIEIPMPTVEQQVSAEPLLKAVEELVRAQRLTNEEIDALVPAILDRVFTRDR